MWENFEKRFPRLRRVVIKKEFYLGLRRDGSVWQGVVHLITSLVKACPSGIEITVGQNGTALRRVFEPLTEGDQYESDIFPSQRTSVLMPLKSFRGPIGKFFKIKYVAERLDYRHRALEQLAILATDQLHFDQKRNEPFDYPGVDCGMRFEKPGDFTVHARSKHWEWSRNWDAFLTPESKAFMTEQENSLKKALQELKEHLKSIFDDWSAGQERRETIAMEWLEQLEYDQAWDTGCEARDSVLWKTFIRVINLEDRLSDSTLDHQHLYSMFAPEQPLYH